jgi:hypothetical protein
MEGIGGVAAVGDRVRESPDDLDELDDRAGPAVCDDERQCLGMRRANVEEMDAEPVDHSAELRQGVQPGLGSAPVVLVGPVVAELPQVGARHALRPVVNRLGLRPAGALETFAQVT